MDFKLVMLSVACFAILIQPAQSGNLPFIIIDTIRNIASASTDTVGAKVAAGIKGATDVGSTLVNTMGQKISAVARASGSTANAGATGVISIGKIIGNAGIAIAKDKFGILGKKGRPVLVKTPVVQEVVEKVEMDTPAVVEEKVFEPYQQRVLSVDSTPLRTVQLKVRQPTTIIESRVASGNKMSPVLALLRDAARSKVNGVVGGPRRGGAVYEIIETPRLYQRPMYETIQVQE